MKHVLCSLVFLASALVTQAQAQLQIDATGLIYAETCEYVPKPIPSFGTVDPKNFDKPGIVGTLMPISFEYKCPSDNFKNVAFRFVGPADLVNPVLLALNPGVDQAQNVGIGFFEEDRVTALPVNVFSKNPKDAVLNTLNFNFYAAYISTGQVTAGMGRAKFTIEISY